MPRCFWGACGTEPSCRHFCHLMRCTFTLLLGKCVWHHQGFCISCDFICATLCHTLTCCLWFAVSSCNSVCLISLVPPTPRLWLLLHHCQMPLSSSTRSLGPRCCSNTQRTRPRKYKVAKTGWKKYRPPHQLTTYDAFGVHSMRIMDTMNSMRLGQKHSWPWLAQLKLSAFDRVIHDISILWPFKDFCLNQVS